MWIIYALASAFFAGVMAILSKIGIKNIDSNLVTGIRTIVVALFAWVMVFIVGSQSSINEIDSKSLLFIVLSGFATGGSWLCYFKALQIGDINKVVPVDKSSTALTMLLSFIFLREEVTMLKVIAMVVTAVGTYMMIERKGTQTSTQVNNVKGNKWLVFAALSAIFASLTAIFGKIGVENVEPNLATAIRTIIALVMAWLLVFGQSKHKELSTIDKHSWIFIILSGFATGLSWLCYYHALQEGPASIVVPLDKLSILITVAFAYFVFKEKLRKKSAIGLLLIVIGTLSLVL